MKILMMDERIKQSETRQFKAIFPDSLNANGTLFGGQAMKWMDEVAYITATRFTRQRMFTVNTENIYFENRTAELYRRNNRESRECRRSKTES